MDKKIYAYNYLIKSGYNPTIAAGLVGNFIHESGLDTGIEGDKGLKGGSSYGIAQWREGRLVGLQNYAKNKKKDWRDIDVQLDYVSYELKNSHKHVWNKLQYAKTPEEAATIVMKQYEIPSKEAQKQSGSIRAKNARELFGGKAVPYMEDGQTTQEEYTAPLATMQGNSGSNTVDFRFAQADEAKQQIQEYQKIEDQIAQMPTYQTQMLQPEVQQQQPTYSYLSDSNLFTLNS